MLKEAAKHNIKNDCWDVVNCKVTWPADGNPLVSAGDTPTAGVGPTASVGPTAGVGWRESRQKN